MAEERVQRDLPGTWLPIARLKRLQTELALPRSAEDGGRLVRMLDEGAPVEVAGAVDAARNALAISIETTRGNVIISEPDQVAFIVGVNICDAIMVRDDIHGEGVNIVPPRSGR